MARKSVVIRLAGESGEGVISSGDILTQAAARGGYWTQTFRTYPAEIKGGPCMYQVRMGDERSTATARPSICSSASTRRPGSCTGTPSAPTG